MQLPLEPEPRMQKFMKAMLHCIRLMREGGAYASRAGESPVNILPVVKMALLGFRIGKHLPDALIQLLVASDFISHLKFIRQLQLYSRTPQSLEICLLADDVRAKYFSPLR